MTRCLLLLTLLLAFALLLWGSVSLSATDVLSVLLQEFCRLFHASSSAVSPSSGNLDSATLRFIVVEHRLPQMLTALSCGAAISVSGVVLQSLFRNPLADPSLLGVNAGASLGVALALLGHTLLGIGSSLPWLTLSVQVLAALLGALAVLLCLLGAARFVRSEAALLVVGVMLSCLSTSGVLLLQHFAPSHEQLRGFLLWGMGTFSAVSLSQTPLLLTALLLPLVALLWFRPSLDALLLGNDYANSMGISVRRSRLWLLLLVGWMSAICTAFCGPVAFIGLAAPHIARRLLRTGLHGQLLPASALLGSLLAMLCVLISHLPPDGSIVPIGAITPLIGAPVVLWLIVRRQ